MKNPIQNNHRSPLARCLGLSLALAAAVLLSACGKSDDHAGHDHDDHGHGNANEAAVMAGFIGVKHTHENAGETCFICDASKRDKGRLWCREHGRYEDRCWICHPELEDKDRLWCREHALYEDECFICHPELKNDQASHNAAPAGAAPVAKTASDELFCHEHNLPERECGICQPDLAAALQPGENLKVRFPSDFAADKVGIRTQTPQAREISPTVSAYCETQYNLNALARITPLVDGVIRSVNADLGDQVSAGEILLEIHSAAVAEAKSAYLSAIVDHDIAKQSFDRLARLQEQSIGAEKDLLKAEGDFRSAKLSASNLRQRLLNLGLSSDEIETVEREQDTSARLAVRAPFAGTLVARAAVVGEAVKVGHELYTIADLSKHWLELSIPSNQAGHVKIGQSVEARFAELPGAKISGRIIWVDTAIDPTTRMVRARAIVEQPGERITAGLFGNARIVVGDGQSGSILPRSAVQRHEGADFVFVRDSKDLFALRRVAVGASRGDSVEIISGVEPDEQVVTQGSFIAMSEFLKSRLGAGCAH